MFTGIARAVRIIVVLALSAGISGPKNTAARAYAQERATAQTTLLDKYPGQPPLPPSVIKREDLTRVVRADTKTERTPLPKSVEDPIQPSGEITKPLDAPLPEPRALQFVAPKNANDTRPVVTVPRDPTDDKLQVVLRMDDPRVLNNTIVQAVLYASATDNTDSVRTTVTLPKGLDYKDGSSKSASYDANTRTLTWDKLRVVAGRNLLDTLELKVNVEAVPATLSVEQTVESSVLKRTKSTTFGLWVGEPQAEQPVSKARGGEVQLRDRITLEFAPDALKADATITSVVYAEAKATSTNTAPQMVFGVGPDMKFDAPALVTVTIDLNNLLGDGKPDANFAGLTLQYLRPEVITRTFKTDSGEKEIAFTITDLEDVPSTFDPKTGLLQARLQHFSTYQVGLNQPADPKPWQFTPNAPGVSLFRGSSSYAYPIYTPTLIDGLQPRLSLNYSSASADSNSGGSWQSLPPGTLYSLGRGWTFDVPKITRLVKRGWQQNGSWHVFVTDYKNLFTLELNGQSHTLVPKDPSAAAGEYVTQDYVPIRVVRCNKRAEATPYATECAQYQPHTATPPNLTEEYWQVRTPDGTLYLFGITGESANIVEQRDYDDIPYSKSVTNTLYAGEYDGGIVRTWFLHGVYSLPRDLVWSGSMWYAATRWTAYYRYETYDHDVVNPAPGCAQPCATKPDPGTRPSKIEYGYHIQTDGTDQPNRFSVNFAYNSYHTSRLDEIKIKWGNTDLRRYTFGYETYQQNGADVNNVVSFTEGHPNGSGGWTNFPIATTLAYTTTTSGGDNANKRLLRTVNNGYGGTWVFDYGPNSINNGHHVLTMTVNSGVGTNAVEKHTYTYADPCYDSSGTYCFTPGRGIKAGDTGASGALMGYDEVTEQVRDATNAIWMCSKHTFHANTYWAYKRLGKEWQTRFYDAACATVVQANRHDYPIEDGSNFGQPATIWRALMAQTSHSLSGDVNSSPFVATTYYYDNYNNAKTIDEGGLNTDINDQRSTWLRYVDNTVAWVIGRVARERVYDGVQPNDLGSAGLEAETLVYYDDLAWNTTPVFGRVTRVDRGKGSLWASEIVGYDPIGNVKTIRDARSIATNTPYTTTASYDLSGQFLLQVANPLNHTLSYDYMGVNGVSTPNGWPAQPWGALHAVRDANTIGTRFAYDAFGRLRKKLASGDTYVHPTEEYFYFDTNSPAFSQRFVRQTSGTGNPYNDGVNAYDSGWWNSFCNMGYWQPDCSADLAALATWERTFYDGLGRPIQTQRPVANWTSVNAVIAIADTAYNPLGAAQWQSVPYASTYVPGGNWYQSPNLSAARTTQGYDALGRVTTVIAPDGTSTTRAYFSTTITVTAANGVPMASSSDGLGRTTEVRECHDADLANGVQCAWKATLYGYDIRGNLTHVTDTMGNAISMTYDALGRKDAMSDPDMGNWSYTYDPNGNLITQTDALGQVLTFGYDMLNRMTWKKANGSMMAGYTYDDTATGGLFAKGRRTESRTYDYANGGASTDTYTQWHYDERGQVTRERRNIQWLSSGYNGASWYDTLFAYDDAGRATQMTYPDGDVVSTGFAVDGQAISLTSTYAGPLVSGATYNPQGQLTQRTGGGNLTTSYGYHPTNFRLQSLQVGSTPTALWTRNYTYDSVGNVTSASDASESLSYSYDALARLKGVSGTYTETYTYDDIGNLKDKGDPVNPGVQLGYPAAMQARPHAPTTYIPTQNGSYQTYWYDNNGNMTWRDEYSPGQTYMAFWQGYTPDNKLYIAVGYGWNAGAGQWEFNNVYSFFYYDADGQRVRKDDPNGTTAYAGPGFEQNAYTGVQRVTYSFNGQVVAVRNGATTSWIHSDHLGSASLATDYTGVPVTGSETRYTPWGEVRTGGVGAITDRGFTSQRREDNLRLNDYVARFYNPFIGKFIQPDSIVPGAGNPQAFNRYAGMLNNPMAFVDPSGHEPCDVYAGSQCVSRYFDPSADTAGNVGGIVAQQVVAQAGASFQNGGKVWQWREQWLVAQGIMALASKVGGYRQLSHLLGSDYLVFNVQISLIRDGVYQASDGPIPTVGALTTVYTSRVPVIGTFVSEVRNQLEGASIRFYDHAFHSDQFARWATVHEFAHTVDRGNLSLSNQFPHGSTISYYAITGNEPDESREYFAEGVATWVYPQGAERYSLHIRGAWPDSFVSPLTVSQSEYLQNHLGR